MLSLQSEHMAISFYYDYLIAFNEQNSFIYTLSR